MRRIRSGRSGAGESTVYARREDVLLANPFGGSSRGWDAVSQALDFASSNFRDGTPVRFEEVSRYTSADLVTLFEVEHWETKVAPVAASGRHSTCVSRPHFAGKATGGSWSVDMPTL
jgi:hypothetical protein